MIILSSWPLNNPWIQVKASPINTGLCIGLDIQTILAQIGCELWFQSIQNHARDYFKLLHTSIWGCCAVQLESEQTPLSCTGCRFRSAALHDLEYMGMCLVKAGFTQSRVRDQLMIKLLGEAMCNVLVCSKFL